MGGQQNELVAALREVFSRWSDGYGFDEDSDEDIDLYRMITDATPSQPEAQAAPEGWKSAANALDHAALELAMLASYAEIIGAISHNRPQIRELCDEVFKLHSKFEQASLAASPDAGESS